MENNRVTAYKVLLGIYRDNKYSNLALKKILFDIKSEDQNFVRELVYGVLENQYLLDYNLERFLRKPLESHKLSEKIILRMGVYQIGFMKGVTDYAAVNETVDLAKKFAGGKQGLINGVLRSFLREGGRVKLPSLKDNSEEAEIEYLSLKYSYAPWIALLWIKQYGFNIAESIMKSTLRPPPMTLRVNLRKINREDLAEALKGEGIETEIVEGHIGAINVRGTDILSNPLYKEGFFSVQDYASQRAVRSLTVCIGRYLGNRNLEAMDLCAAPGGKSMALSEYLGEGSSILAVDLYKNKLNLIAKEAHRLGMDNIYLKQGDSRIFNEDLRESKDVVLCDVPCSGLGVIRRRPEIKLMKKEDDIRELPNIQYEILCRGSEYTRPGGLIMYSTCTLNRKENRELLNKFLSKKKNFTLLREVEMRPDKDDTDGFFFGICRKGEI